MFSKILIANRGEIAVRVIRTARQLGYQTVAVYSEADADAPHVQAADEAVCIGAAAVGTSYLKIDHILEAARKTGADAIHPGYGFLSENAAFARACIAASITFIGPGADAIELMGSKRLSKIAMLQADVPCIPGYEGSDQSDAILCNEAKRIGFPVMIKASAGGGGRGMRLVDDESHLLEQLRTARSEAENAFGSGELILEKAVLQPRHIEIQVFADQQGNAVYLGERDCSIQRRHQKVVEEAPSPFVDDTLRAKMGEAAVQAAMACGYVGAGTVEFLVDTEKNFYFLEMNTRLQVEHPVTELITGTDLVAWQIQVAAGEPLPLQQEDISLQGHAIEVRLYAEDPANGFMPQTGSILHWQAAVGDGIRIDSGIQSGQTVSAFYDPMLAKIIGYGRNREEARRRLLRALRESCLLGVLNNSEFLSHVLRHPAFIAGQATTAFIGDDFAGHPSIQAAKANPLLIALGLMILHRHSQSQCTAPATLHGWHNVDNAPWPYDILVLDEHCQRTLAVDGKRYLVTNGQEDAISLHWIAQNETELVFEYDGVRQTCTYVLSGQTVYLKHNDTHGQITDLSQQPKATSESAGSGRIQASMDGAIVAVDTEVGRPVQKGQTLVVLEAMKMEHPLKADCAGTVRTIHIQAGQQVKNRQLLVEIDTDGEISE